MGVDPVGSKNRPMELAPQYAQRPGMAPDLAALVNSPFFRDTLSRLSTEPPQVRSMIPSEEEPGVGGYVHRDRPGTAVMSRQESYTDDADYQPESARRLLAHEIIHIMDLDKALPKEDRELIDFLKKGAATSPNYLHRGLNGPEEYLAAILSYALVQPNKKYDSAEVTIARRLLENRMRKQKEKKSTQR